MLRKSRKKVQPTVKKRSAYMFRIGMPEFIVILVIIMIISMVTVRFFEKGAIH